MDLTGGYQSSILPTDSAEDPENYVPFSGTIIQPGGGNIHEDAIRLGRLRKQKRGDMLLVALRSFEPRLQGIEDNASSGAPLVWVDVGLSELISPWKKCVR